MIWMFLVGGVITGIAGDILSKRWLESDNASLVAYALTAYVVGCLFWFGILKKSGNSLAKAGAIWTVSQCVVAVLVGVVLFGEELDSRACVGVFFGILSVVLLT